MKAKLDWNEHTIAFSRTDSIGDVMLTLPMTSWLKMQYPSCKIVFICRNYTKLLVESFQAIDEVITIEELDQHPKSLRVSALQARGIDAIVHVFPKKELAHLFKRTKTPVRIGTSHRSFHFLTCNVRPNFTRRKSDLHEAQLNFELLRPFGLEQIPTIEDLNQWTNQFSPIQHQLPNEISSQLKQQFVCLHPKSQGSAKEWPMEKYVELANRLIDLNYQVCFTGTENEGLRFRNELPNHPNCIDTSGKLSILELVELIRQSDGLVACSTGPLHIAGFLNKRAVGLFAPKRPIHPGRWKPLGKYAKALVFDENCDLCKKGKACNCIEKISVENVVQALTEKI